MAGHGGSGQERWLITYADLITLLLAFFIVLYSTSTADAARFRAVQQAVQRAFNVDVLSGNSVVGLHTSGAVLSPDAIAALSAESGPASSAEGARSQVETLKQDLEQLAPPGSRGGIEVRERPDGLAISVYGVLLFDSGKADLRPESRDLLRALADRVRPLGNDIRVEGHTDSITPEGGPFPTNWELSNARALAVTRFLLDEAALPPDRLSTASFAEYRPVASNETREGRLRNRRVDLVLLYPEAPVGVRSDSRSDTEQPDAGAADTPNRDDSAGGR